MKVEYPSTTKCVKKVNVVRYSLGHKRKQTICCCGIFVVLQPRFMQSTVVFSGNARFCRSWSFKPFLSLILFLLGFGTFLLDTLLDAPLLISSLSFVLAVSSENFLLSACFCFLPECQTLCRPAAIKYISVLHNHIRTYFNEDTRPWIHEYLIHSVRILQQNSGVSHSATSGSCRADNIFFNSCKVSVSLFLESS